jgi:hypothetical protein
LLEVACKLPDEDVCVLNVPATAYVLLPAVPLTEKVFPVMLFVL